MDSRIYIVRPAIFVPVALSVMALVAGITISWWSLTAIPFIWLGSVCAAPNLNLANGCLSYLSMGAGWIVTFFFPPLGAAIFIGALAGYYLSALEKYLRMRVVIEEDTIHPPP